MNPNELVNMIDNMLKAIKITPPERSIIDDEVADRLIQLYGDKAKDYVIDYVEEMLIDKTTKKIAHKRCSISDLYLTTIRNWIKEKYPLKEKQSYTNSNNYNNNANNANKSNKYVEIAMKILDEIQLPTNDEEFEKWYQAKCRLTIGYAPPAYLKPYANTTLKAKKAIQDKYQKAYCYAIMDAAEKHMQDIKDDPNMHNLALRAFDKDDYDIMALK